MGLTSFSPGTRVTLVETGTLPLSCCCCCCWSRKIDKLVCAYDYPSLPPSLPPSFLPSCPTCRSKVMVVCAAAGTWEMSVLVVMATEPSG